MIGCCTARKQSKADNKKVPRVRNFFVVFNGVILLGFPMILQAVCHRVQTTIRPRCR
jgi:hypothetical protein